VDYLPCLGSRFNADFHVRFADELVVGEVKMMFDFKQHVWFLVCSYTVK